MKKPLVTLAAIALSAFAASVDAKAQTNTYTSSSAFFAAISSSNYTETFNSLSTNGVSITTNTFITTPTNFSGNGFNFTATTDTSGPNIPPDPNNQLFGLTNGGGIDRWLTIFWPQYGLVFTNFSLNVSAIGGNFFATDFNGFYTNSPISFNVLLSDSSSFSTNLTALSTSSFFGVSFSTNVSITALVISNLNVLDPQFPTVNNLTVGVVPEPSTYALLALSAAGLAGYVIRRRRS
jgi:hypothetical protein